MLWAVIMAGGRGTRFWPESRNETPKQFLPILGRKTLLEQTLHRLKGVVPSGRILVVTQKDKASFVRRLLRLPPSQIIGEPVGRNTAPCMILAAAQIIRKDPDAVLALLPADHRIEKPAAFRNALKAAFRAAEKKGLPVTFGVKPAFAATGYGYLEREMRPVFREGAFPVFRLKRFHEKPDLQTARRFLKVKHYLWNSGMFVWRCRDLLESAQVLLPKAYRLARRIAQERSHRVMSRYFPQMPDISIDYGLMEKMKGRILTLPADFGWNDLGGWKTVADLSSKDSQGNTVQGKAVLVDCRDNFVKTKRRLVAMAGVRNLVVIDTQDALLICPKNETESIRRIVEKLKKENLGRYL